jgi:hypothetical protein
MKVIISRQYNKNEVQASLFVFSGMEIKYRAKTIELPDLGNQHNISCIPEGKYDCMKIVHPKLGNVFSVLTVPDRTGIMIHQGNYVNGPHQNSTGCILPGEFFEDLDGNGTIDVCNSKKVMDCLNEILPDLFQLIII